MDKDFINDIIEISKEFDEKEGYITCEVTIHKDEIEEFEKVVKENTNIKLGKWVIHECETCVGYHGEGSLHCEIVRNNYIGKYKDDGDFYFKII